MNRRGTIWLVSVAIIAALFAGLFVALRAAQRDASAMETTARDAVRYAARCRELNDTAAALEARAAADVPSGIVEAVDRVTAPLGLKDRVKSVKNLPSGPREQLAELSLAGLTPNELANVLYSIETAPMLLVVRKADVRSSFERQGTLNASLTLALIKTK